MAKNIAVIGDSESIKGFAAIGMDIYPCDDNENAPHLFRKIADGDNYAVIFITEEKDMKKGSSLPLFLSPE